MFLIHVPIFFPTLISIVMHQTLIYIIWTCWNLYKAGEVIHLLHHDTCPSIIIISSHSFLSFSFSTSVRFRAQYILQVTASIHLRSAHHKNVWIYLSWYTGNFLFHGARILLRVARLACRGRPELRKFWMKRAIAHFFLSLLSFPLSLFLSLVPAAWAQLPQVVKRESHKKKTKICGRL